MINRLWVKLHSVIFIILMIGLYPQHDTDFRCAKNQTKLRSKICPLDIAVSEM